MTCDTWRAMHGSHEMLVRCWVSELQWSQQCGAAGVMECSHLAERRAAVRRCVAVMLLLPVLHSRCSAV